MVLLENDLYNDDRSPNIEYTVNHRHMNVTVLLENELYNDDGSPTIVYTVNHRHTNV